MNEHTHKNEPTDIKAYQPLIAIAVVVALASWALSRAGISFMHGFMGLFFCQFALFKYFDLNGFANSFRTYDIIAKKSRTYAYAYPAMELLLGLGYLSHIVPALVYLATIVLMAVSAVGVFKNMRKGISCACLGTVLNVPLSTVSLIENVGMGAMAVIMLMSL